MIIHPTAALRPRGPGTARRARADAAPRRRVRVTSFLVLTLAVAVAGPETAAAQAASAAAGPGAAEPGRRIWPQAPTQPYPAAPDLESPGSELRGAIERYSADRALLDRSYPVPYAPSRRARMREFHEGWLRTLGGMDFDALSHDGQVDYLLLKNHLTAETRRLELYERSLAGTAELAPFTGTVAALWEARRWGRPMDARAAADTLAALKAQVERARARIAAGLEGGGPVPDRDRIVAARAVQAVAQLRGTLEEWSTFYDGYDPLFTWWAAEPYRAADAALERYAAFLREAVVGVRPGEEDPIIANPVGRDFLMSELAYEMIPYSIEELLAIAQQEFAWIRQELLKASRELGYGDDWRAAVSHVKSLHPPPGAQADTVRELAMEAVEFLQARDLVTLPDLAVESWRLAMRPPERQRGAAFFTGGEVITMSYPTHTMDHDLKLGTMRGNNTHFSRATVHHELIPGHHLQMFMSARHRPYRRLFTTPFYGEGWALHWEFLFYDQGLARTPEDRVGFLVWRQHRAGRILFTLNLHLGNWTPEECIDFMVEEVGHERSSATAEVRGPARGVNPLYQSSYMLGALQLRALHKEVVGSGRMTDREFHDAVLRQNSIPIEMVRAALTGQPLRPDHQAAWRFYGDPLGRPKP